MMSYALRCIPAPWARDQNPPQTEPMQASLSDVAGRLFPNCETYHQEFTRRLENPAARREPLAGYLRKIAEVLADQTPELLQLIRGRDGEMEIERVRGLFRRAIMGSPAEDFAVQKDFAGLLLHGSRRNPLRDPDIQHLGMVMGAQGESEMMLVHARALNVALWVKEIIEAGGRKLRA